MKLIKLKQVTKVDLKKLVARSINLEQFINKLNIIQASYTNGRYLEPELLDSTLVLFERKVETDEEYIKRLEARISELDSELLDLKNKSNKNNPPDLYW